MNADQIKELLEEKYHLFNRPGFITDDPISIPHGFQRKEDIEISAFLSATIAWGRRDIIIRNAFSLMERMDMAPYEFVCHAQEREFQRLADFVHRTFNGEDCVALIKSLQQVYTQFGGLETIFTEGITSNDSTVYSAILQARERLSCFEDFPSRTHKHLANPAKGSSAKRLNMFLRWMVRKDDQGVDFGIWNGIAMHQLVCPLDVHTGNVARHLGILSRKQNDWKAAMELTTNLKKFDPEDPVRYDFSLFGLGVYEGTGKDTL